MSFKDIKTNNFKTCLVVGHFDPVHIGHRELINSCIKYAVNNNLKSHVVIIDNTETASKYIYSAKERKYLISKLKPDYITVIKHNKFSYDDIIKKTNTEIIFCGSNTLIPFETNKIIKIPEVFFQNEKISFNLCEKALKEYDIHNVIEILGAPYLVIGEVIHGKGKGRTVGMPTANLDYSTKKILIKNGVYYTLSAFSNERKKGLTSLGRRPAVDNDERITIETYLLDFNKNIYGVTVALEFIDYIRPVLKLSGLQAVREQMEHDMEWVKKNALFR